MSQAKENYEKLIVARNKVAQIKKEVTKLKQDAFGEETAEEDIAKRFFDQLATSADQMKDTEKELQEKKSSLEQARKEEKDATDAFLKSLTTMRFPLKLGPEGIEKKDNNVVFLFSENLGNDLLEEIRKNLEPDCLASGHVQIQGDRIIAKGFADVSEAMKEVMSHVDAKIWKTASGALEVDKYVLELKNRDDKIQKMLNVLLEAGDKPLSRKEMEARAKLQKGDLRGVLYVVLKRDPYIRGAGKGQYCLTEVGKRILQRYREKYPSPLVNEVASQKNTEPFSPLLQEREKNE